MHYLLSFYLSSWNWWKRYAKHGPKVSSLIFTPHSNPTEEFSLSPPDFYCLIYFLPGFCHKKPYQKEETTTDCRLLGNSTFFLFAEKSFHLFLPYNYGTFVCGGIRVLKKFKKYGIWSSRFHKIHVWETY